METNTIKKLVINHKQSLSESHEFKPSETDFDFESGQDSTVLVRERLRGSKLGCGFQKRKGVLLEKTNNTTTFLTQQQQRRQNQQSCRSGI